MKQPPTDVFPPMKPPCTECLTAAAIALKLSAKEGDGAGIGLEYCVHHSVLVQLMRYTDTRLVTSCTWGLSASEAQEEIQAAADNLQIPVRHMKPSGGLH